LGMRDADLVTVDADRRSGDADRGSGDADRPSRDAGGPSPANAVGWGGSRHLAKDAPSQAGRLGSADRRLGFRRSSAWVPSFGRTGYAILPKGSRVDVRRTTLFVLTAGDSATRLSWSTTTGGLTGASPAGTLLPHARAPESHARCCPRRRVRRGHRLGQTGGHCPRGVGPGVGLRRGRRAGRPDLPAGGSSGQSRGG